MTDSNEESGGGLPTAEEAFECPNCGEVRKSDIDLTRHIATTHSDKVLVPEKIELVRRKDVKALIQEAVEHELEKARDSLLVVTDKGGGTDRYRERLQEGLTYRIENLDVDELLEELEQ